MPIKKQIEIEAIAKDAIQQIQSLNEKVAGLEDNLKAAGEQTKKTNKLLGGLKNLVQGGLGLAVVQKAFELLKDTFSSNQKVVNFFNTALEGLSLSFNDLFKFLDSNVGTVIDYFKGIFENPVQSIKNFGQAIVDNIIERINSSLEALGFLGEAVVKVFQGDFAGAAESAKNAGKELFDVVTGIDNTFDKVAETLPTVVNGISNYAKSTLDAAQQTVELNRQSEIGIAKNRIILEQKDREAEKLRQIRDDESKTIAERIEANNKLAEVLNEQERLMLANADAVIAAAQAQFDKNNNDENQIALLEAKAEREGILAQIEGFRSEQLMNINSLERERIDLIQEAKDAEIAAADAAIAAKEKEAKIKAELAEQNRETVMGALGTVTTLVGENTAFGKATATAQAVMDTYAGANKALAQGGIFGAIGAAGIIATGLANVRNIVSTETPTPPSGAKASSPTPIQPPAFNVVGAAPENQLAQAIGGQESQPVKAYVVSNDVTNAQALDRNIIEGASIG